VGDNLIIFPSANRTDISYLGGWNIENVSNSLTLSGNYIVDTNKTDRLTYLIGNEERLLGGENGSIGELKVAHVEMVQPETDLQGYAYFDIIYDFELAGHTVSVEAHGEENGKRIGTSGKVFLRLDGDNFYADDVLIPNNQQTKRTVRMHLSIQPSCSGNRALVDTPVSSASFEITPAENCQIVGVDKRTDGYGNIMIDVATDGNVTATAQCTLSWQGGPGSLRYEY
jgi:hypothetical protein